MKFGIHVNMDYLYLMNLKQFIIFSKILFIVN